MDGEISAAKPLLDPAPKSVSAYLDPQYWNNRFSGEDHYEWLKDYSHFQHLIRRHLHRSHSVLELGCGNSRLCEDLSCDSFASLTCTDLSPVAVQRMRKRLAEKGIAGIRVLEADMLDLPFGSDCFDVVIEKGTMRRSMGIHRVLKPGGVYVSISFGQPHFRRPLFEAPHFTWSVECDTFGDGFHYFFYTLKKGRRALDNNNCCTKKISTPSFNLLHEEMDSEDYLFRTCLDEL